MTRTFTVIPLLLGGIGVLAIACSAGSNTGGTAWAKDGGEAETASSGIDAGAGGDDSAADALPPGQALLRIAQLSPDLPPVDVCVAPHGTGLFQGPLLAQLAASLGDERGTDAAPPGLAYAQVSAYLSLDEGTYDVRLVAAGATSCSPSLTSASAPDDGDAASSAEAGTGDAEAGAGDAEGGAGADDADAGAGDVEAEAGEAEVEGGDEGPDTDAASGDAASSDTATGTPDWTDLPWLAFNTRTTLVVAGDWRPAGADPGLTVALLTDDAVLAGPGVVLRAINAVPGWPAADFGLGSFGTDWTPILTAVPFAAASAQSGVDDSAVDSNGYLAIAPQQGQAMGARPSSSDAGAAVAVAASVVIDFGSIATVIAIGGKTGDLAHPPALLLCTDNQPSGGLLSDCSVSP